MSDDGVREFVWDTLGRLALAWILILLILIGSAVLNGCAAIGATAGALGGAAIGGVPGAVVGAAGGAEAGDFVASKKRAEKDADRARAEAILLRDQLTTERATRMATERIAAFNAGLPEGSRHASPTFEPYEPPAPSLFSIAWKALLGLLGLGTGWHYRREIKGWFWGLPDKVRGRVRGYRQP